MSQGPRTLELETENHWQVACHEGRRFEPIQAARLARTLHVLGVLCFPAWSRLPKGRFGLVLGACLNSCASSFPEPSITTHANTDYIEVPYLPPAALVEVAGDPPGRDSVWYDGHWVWRGDRYLWKRGGWATNTDGLSYAPWKSLVLEDGRLMFAEGTWYEASGRKVPAPKVVKPAQTPPNEVTSEFESPR